MRVPDSYVRTADDLVTRILELGKPDEIAALKCPFGLFKLGLDTSDLKPSLYQAQWALGRAQTILRERER